MKKLISIIIPCYNEEESLPLLYEALKEVMRQMEFYSFEVLFVDDGSKDNTMLELNRVALEDSRIKFISFSRNFGKEAAMYAGFCNAMGDYVAVMDADMQDPPSLLPEMVRCLEEEDYDSVATRRVTRDGEPAIRSFFARMFYKIINKISDADVVDGARDFRLMKRNMVESICQMSEYNRFSKGIFGWLGFKTKWLPYKNVNRIAGETKWNFWKLLKYSLEGIINFSQVPLVLSSWIGIILTVVSIVAIMFVVIRKMAFGNPVQGWSSTICIISLLGGIQLFCIGILGQYIAKTYMEVKNRPHYIINKSNIEEVKKIN